MRKLLLMLMATIVVCIASCKKDAIVKQMSPKPKAVETVKTSAATVPKAPYDYQKAIMAKRTLNPQLAK